MNDPGKFFRFSIMIIFRKKNTCFLIIAYNTACTFHQISSFQCNCHIGYNRIYLFFIAVSQCENTVEKIGSHIDFHNDTVTGRNDFITMLIQNISDFRKIRTL